VQQLAFLAKNARDTQRLDQMKPTQVTLDVTTHWNEKKKSVEVKQNNYQKRLRESDRKVQCHSDRVALALITLLASAP
jgi:uncharacterized membrane protein